MTVQVISGVGVGEAVGSSGLVGAVEAAFDWATLESYEAEWDAGVGDSITVSSGTNVTDLDDVSGNGHHFDQVVGVPQSNGTQNGRTTIVFDGSDDGLRGADFLYDLDGFVMVMAVRIPADQAGHGAIWAEAADDADPNIMAQVRHSADGNANKVLNYIRDNGGNDRLLAYSDEEVADGDWKILTWIDTGTSWTLRANGVVVVDDVAYTRAATTPTRLALGFRDTITEREWLEMEFANAVVLNDPTVDASVITDIEEAMDAKWGLGVVA